MNNINKLIEMGFHDYECFEKYLILIIESNSIAVIMVIDRKIPLSLNGGSKKKDKINFEMPVNIKLKVKKILNPLSIFKLVR
ncbi:MAG: hypothetical protein ACOCRX_11980 [Candidatus Woesearchaeota archaeon]